MNNTNYKNDIDNTNNVVIKPFDISNLQFQSKTLKICITKLHRFSCILGFSESVYEACRIILTHVENEKYLDKHTPLSRTSAIIYYIIERLNISINKHQILQTCEVSHVTLNKCYQKLIKYKNELSKILI